MLAPSVAPELLPPECGFQYFITDKPFPCISFGNFGDMTE